jgi:putative nucleotidyltransferase with HDIG domain
MRVGFDGWLLDRITGFVSGLLEGRDPDLAVHHQRVAASAESFARDIGFSAKDTELLTIGARLHDLGKLSISEHILNKPARLTGTEFALVQQHTDIGRKLLAPLGLDPRISEIVYYHHENYDGSGYPEGLSGESIPILARMIRIWDSFDALTMDRPYHKGISANEALRLMRRESHLYDPVLLKNFCETVRMSIRRRA